MADYLNSTSWPLMLADDRPASGDLTVTAPYDSAEIATVATCDAEHVDHALGVAHGLYRDRDTWLALHERVAILESTASIMAENRELLATEAAREGGKPSALAATHKTGTRTCLIPKSHSSFVWTICCRVFARM